MKPFVSFVACALPLWAAAEQNLVANGDFSLKEKGRLVAWEACGNPSTVEQRLETDSEGDARFARLVCTRCEKNDPSSHAMLAQVGRVRLEKDKLYAFSCRVKAKDLNGRVLAVAVSDTRDWENCGLDAEIPLTSEWTLFQTRFKATRTVADSSRLQFWHHDNGSFCLADVRLTEAPPVEIAFTDLLPPGGSKNLIPNASFECGAFGWSSLGQNTGWGNLSGLHGHVVTVGDAPHGRQILRIPLGGDQTPTLYFDYLTPVVRKETQPLAANKGWIPVQVGQPYTLSCFMRASEDGVPALLGLRLLNPDESGWNVNDDRRPIVLTRQWQRFTATFRPHKRCVFAALGPAFESNPSHAVEVDVDAVQFEAGEQASAFAPRSAVEVGVETPGLTSPSGVFVAGQAPKLLLQSSGDGSPRAKVAFEVTDYFGAKVALPDATADATIPLPPEWKGYYRVRVLCDADRHLNGRSIAIAIVPKPTCPDTVVGINHAFAHAPLIQLARKAGVTWYRDWSLKWQDLEPRPGEFHWEVGDAQIDRVLAEQVHLMSLLPPFPSAEWNSEAPDALATSGYPGLRLRQAWAPKDPKALARFVGQTANHFKGRIQIWEFLNEALYTDYALPGREKAEYTRCGAKRYAMRDYVDLLKLAYASIKQAAPSCRVIGGVACEPDPMALDSIAKGCLDACDIFNLHIYPGIRQPESFIPKMKTLAEAMDAAGKRKPIWITEFSYYGTDTYPREPFIPDTANGVDQQLLQNEKQCADYTIRFFTVMLSFGVEKIFVHAGSNGAVNATQFECCLFDAGGAPKKIVPALAVFAELMGSRPKFTGFRPLGQSGYSYAFETEKGSLTVSWDTDDNAHTSVALPDGCDCFDLMGGKHSGPQIVLGASPVYFLKRR